MIEIGINQVVKNFGFKNVLNEASFEVMTGERVAIVGRNGTGKSTILKIIAGKEHADKGAVSIRRGATIGYLEQIPELTEDHTTTWHMLMASFEHLHQLEAQMRELETAMTTERDAEKLDQLMRRYTYVQNLFMSQDGYSMEENFNRIVSGFSLDELLDRPFNVLSGGQKTIVKLACTILSQPDILLLDEPTNHLDVRTLDWFEDMLSKYRGTVLIVSHDRYFLDMVATKTIILYNGKCTAYQGNYSFSIQERERQLLIEFEHYKTQQKKVAAMKAAIKRYREWAAQGNNEDLFRKAKELEHRLEKMELLEKPQLEKAKIPLSFAGQRTGKEVLRISDFSLAFGENALFHAAQLLVLERDKICLMGDNGSGKTTLIKVLLGEEIPHQGKIQVSPSALIGYIPQEIRFEDDTDTVVKAFQREYVCTEGEARNILAKYFFFGDAVYKRITALSGGEKVLLKLAALIQKQINFLILDEPTNHIDIDMREVLEEALLDYTGTLLFISHDRYFIGKIASRRVIIKNQKIVPYGRT